jgi:hypothetical protein
LSRPQNLLREPLLPIRGVLSDKPSAELRLFSEHCCL